MQNANKYFFNNHNKVVNVGIADIKIAEPPVHLRTNLGSCIALILYDNVKKIGGLVHIMLPKSYNDEIKPGKCADTAVPELIKRMVNRHDCDKSNLVAKIFGGARIIESSNDIGKSNTEEVVRLLKEKRIKIHTKKTGGSKGYLIQLDTSSGIVMCRVFGQETEYY